MGLWVRRTIVDYIDNGSSGIIPVAEQQAADRRRRYRTQTDTEASRSERQ